MGRQMLHAFSVRDLRKTCDDAGLTELQIEISGVAVLVFIVQLYVMGAAWTA